jgi:AraC family carnitine catabolism transcriptional activator
MEQAATKQDHYDFLLLPEFSFIGFAALMEPLRVANRFRPGASRWRILSADGGPVTASNGIAIMPDGAMSDISASPCLFVVTSFNPLDHYTPAIGAWLRQMARSGAVMGAIDTGCFILAEAGLLRGATVTLHWEAIPAFSERYPDVNVSPDLFKILPKHITSAGATACIDLALELLAQRQGRALSLIVSEQLVQGQMRGQDQHQRMQVASRYHVHNKKLVAAIELMEGNLENPLAPDELAERVHVTRRQLERLFRAHLDTTPSGFYLKLRLERGRSLLQQTAMSVVEISLACGFDSPSYFSRAYRKQFGLSPRLDRVMLEPDSGRLAHLD